MQGVRLALAEYIHARASDHLAAPRQLRLTPVCLDDFPHPALVFGRVQQPGQILAESAERHPKLIPASPQSKMLAW